MTNYYKENKSLIKCTNIAKIGLAVVVFICLITSIGTTIAFFTVNNKFHPAWIALPSLLFWFFASTLAMYSSICGNPNLKSDNKINFLNRRRL
jgi:hypothetical protein